MIGKIELLNFLNTIGNKLEREITLVAVGGTAMTLLNLKNSTIDMDFTGPAKDIVEFDKILKNIPHGYFIQTWPDGFVFVSQLPDDYLDKSHIIPDQTIKKVSLRALHPVDIVVSKIARLDSRDKEDIETCIRSYKLTRIEIEDRWKVVFESYSGNDSVLQDKLREVLTRYF